MIHPTSTGTVLGDLRNNGRVLLNNFASRSEAEKFLEEHTKNTIKNNPTFEAANWSSRTAHMCMLEHALSREWVLHGCNTYELSHDVAALFSLTSAPPIDWSHAPHSSFVIKIPRVFFPVMGENVSSPDTYLLIARPVANEVCILVIADCDTTAETCTFFPVGTTFSNPEKAANDGPSVLEEGTTSPRELFFRSRTLAVRYATNLVAYIGQHRDLVRAKGYTKRSSSTFSVAAPAEVFITKDFRTAAIAAVQSTTIGGVRRALAHFVRGHWRNQAVGEARADRKLTWVRPHKRGDESIGSVVSRLERMRMR